jgi:hypothetical protein
MGKDRLVYILDDFALSSLRKTSAMKNATYVILLSTGQKPDKQVGKSFTGL